MPSSRLSSRYTSQSKPVPPTSPRSLPATLLHVVAFLSLSNSFRLLFQPSPVNDFMESQKGGHWSFLTVLSLGVTWLTFVAALLGDIYPTQLFDRVKTSLAVIAVPVEGLVSLLYWSLQAYDPSLLTPPEAVFKIPFALDVSIHALPAFFLWTDFLVFSPRMSKNVNPLLISATATLAYTTWMEYTTYYNKRFPYPFLNTMTRVQRSIFYLCMIPIIVGLFHTSNGVHRLIRGKNAGVQADAAAKATEKIEAKADKAL